MQIHMLWPMRFIRTCCYTHALSLMELNNGRVEVIFVCRKKKSSRLIGLISEVPTLLYNVQHVLTWSGRI